MAGIYVHIPFCKKRCLYCDFYSTTLLDKREAYVKALLKEIEERKKETDKSIRTIYIGGGTPSTLDAADIQRILKAIGTDDAEEITMEVNPGNITEAYVQALRRIGVNRLSMGVQSFQDHLLQLIGRRHTAMQAIDAIHRAQDARFENLSIDLMYALPTQTMEQWKADIETALTQNVQHISCYGLMYEEGTVLYNELMSERIKAIDEDEENAMYDYLCARLQQAGYVHYEVSNFALPGYESKHNSSYWDGTPYIGIGAGAHSYIGNVRSWNPNDINAYIQGTAVRESEMLTSTDLYNERIMLGLRTHKGVPREAIKKDITAQMEACLLQETEDGHVVATQQGLHILNRIIEDLMI